MNHILLVNHYLFTKKPKIIRIRVIKDNMAKYNQVLSYLSSIPESARLYVICKVDSAKAWNKYTEQEQFHHYGCCCTCRS
jgi:hypothetical protein